MILSSLLTPALTVKVAIVRAVAAATPAVIIAAGEALASSFKG